MAELDTETAASPLDVADLRTRVGMALDAFVGARLEELAALGDDLEPLSAAITELLSGGKRLRPAFCYWAWRGAGGADTSAAVAAATSLELLQACALIHDDVMDGSDTRRGLPSAHRRFAALHQGSQWLGSAESFGVGSAILLGDLCLSWADQMLLSSELPWDDLRRAKPVYDDMRTELMAGQYLDLLEQARGGGSVERALRVVRYKSAKYTIERPLQLGATLAGADLTLVAGFSAYGLPLGEAFQLRDDVLGVFGDPALTGKPAGDDLREGKRTVLVAKALEAATPAQAHLLQSGLGNPDLDAERIESLREVIVDTGALRAVEELIDILRDDSVAALDSMGLTDPADSVLRRLITAATARKG
ncbi:MAG: hypothetical protein RLZ55_475 [Actinomycetota bacterium]